MQKLLTLAALVAGVALFAGCNKTATVETTTDTTTPTVDTTTVTTEEVTPADTTTGGVDATVTTDMTVKATAE